MSSESVVSTGPILCASGLGKAYELTGPDNRARYKTLRDTLSGLWRWPFEEREEPHSPFWALRDASFEIHPGEVVGVIGRNGSGKSTLLKILARITAPTAGSAVLKGRVGSLLEVGTGFHPELNGRENIMMNGAILGMKRAEILRVFDQIVDFAEIRDHLETAVKHYSSGMYMRLAFAVAAHLETEILFVDEVLAVGDIAFQQKCLGRINEVSRSGRTILLVSHNMQAVHNVCSRCIWLDRGHIVADGPTDDVVAAYEARVAGKNAAALEQGILYSDPQSAGPVVIRQVEVLDAAGNPKTSIATWDDVRFRFTLEAAMAFSFSSVQLKLETPRGTPVLALSTSPHGRLLVPLRPGLNVVECSIPRLPLAGGQFILTAGVTDSIFRWLAPMRELAPLSVGPANVYNAPSAMPMASEGLVAVPHEWRIAG